MIAEQNAVAAKQGQNLSSLAQSNLTHSELLTWILVYERARTLMTAEAFGYDPEQYIQSALDDLPQFMSLS